jgi:hypothetical protein
MEGFVSGDKVALKVGIGMSFQIASRDINVASQ